MGFNVEPYGGKRDPRSVTMSRGGGGEMDEMQELFEQLMGGEGAEGVEGMEDFDWEGLWDDFMGGEEGYQEEGGVPNQAANRPTMFGGFLRPGGMGSDSGKPLGYW
jgi:hypothetical protein